MRTSHRAPRPAHPARDLLLKTCRTMVAASTAEDIAVAILAADPDPGCCDGCECPARMAHLKAREHAATARSIGGVKT